MKSAAKPRNETTRLSALATGLRLMTTAAPNTSIRSANVQNRYAGITSFLLVPLQNDAVHHAADFEQFVLVMPHLFAREAGDGVILAQINRLFRTHLLTHAAENAADHVDIEFLRI